MPNTFHKGINDIERITIIPADNKKTSTTETGDVFGTKDNYRQLTNATQPADVADKSLVLFRCLRRTSS